MFIKGLNVFILNRNISEFLRKNLCKKKKVCKNCFDKREKSWTYLKMFRKKHKSLKAIWAVLACSKPKIFSVSQPWWPTFFQDLGPPTISVLLRPWFPGNIAFLLTVIVFFTLMLWHWGMICVIFCRSVYDSILNVFDFWPYFTSLIVCSCTIIVSSSY